MSSESEIYDGSPETVLTRLWNKVTPDMRFVFLSTLIMGLITHLFVFTNKFINGDDLYYLYDNIGMHNLSFTAQRGRWCVWLATQITSDNYSMPWVIGFFSLVFIAISACLVVSIFDIRSRLHMSLIGGLMVTFAAVCCTFSYMFTAAVYFLALLLSVLSVWLTRKYRWGFIPGGILLAFSLGIYQAYICMSIALFAVCVLKETLEVDTDNRTLFIHIGKYLACGIIGVVSYYLVLQFIFLFTGNTLTSYQDADKFTMGSFVRIGFIVSAIKEFVKFFACGYGVIGMLSWLFRIATFFTAVMILIYTIKLCINKQKKTRNIFQMMLTFGILFTLPIWICSICGVANFVHYLMIYSYVTLYLLLIVLVEMCDRNRTATRHTKVWLMGRWISFCSVVTIIYVGYLTTNEHYLKSHLTYEQSYAFVLRIIDRLEQIDGFDLETTPVAVVYPPKLDIEDPQESLMKEVYRRGERLLVRAERQGGRFDSSLMFTSSLFSLDSHHFQEMGKNYFQKNFIVFPEKDKEWLANPEVQAMPYFPAKESIREIDGTIVVKVSSEIVGFGW